MYKKTWVTFLSNIKKTSEKSFLFLTTVIISFIIGSFEKKNATFGSVGMISDV